MPEYRRAVTKSSGNSENSFLNDEYTVEHSLGLTGFSVGEDCKAGRNEVVSCQKIAIECRNPWLEAFREVTRN